MLPVRRPAFVPRQEETNHIVSAAVAALDQLAESAVLRDIVRSSGLLRIVQRHFSDDDSDPCDGGGSGSAESLIQDARAVAQTFDGLTPGEKEVVRRNVMGTIWPSKEDKKALVKNAAISSTRKGSEVSLKYLGTFVSDFVCPLLEPRFVNPNESVLSVSLSLSLYFCPFSLCLFSGRSVEGLLSREQVDRTAI